MADTTKRTVTLKKDQVQRLIYNFPRTEVQTREIAKLMQDKIDLLLTGSAPISDEALEKLEAYVKPIYDQLGQYTDGFARFCRSVAKWEAQKKPDSEFMEQVRDIRHRADELRANFEWAIDNMRQNVAFHNMTHGDFSLDSSEPMTPPPPVIPVEGAAPSTGASGGSGTESQPKRSSSERMRK